MQECFPQEEAFAVAEGIGLQKKQLICMQGPFSRELNAAMLRETKADFLVTKESGAAGGFADKVQAAGDVKATCVVIIRPMQESGYSLEEVETMILQEYHKKQKEHSVTGTKPEITLLGIGMGAPESIDTGRILRLPGRRLYYWRKAYAGSCEKQSGALVCVEKLSGTPKGK